MAQNLLRIFACPRPGLSATGRWCVAALIAVFILASARLHPVEWDASHGHVVIGGSGAEQTRVLATHLRDGPTHAQATPVRRAENARFDAGCGCAHVLVVRGADGTAGSVLGLGVSAATTARPPVLNPPTVAEHVLATPATSHSPVALPVPEPPPRPS